VLAVACNHRVGTPAGKLRADQIATYLPQRGWQRLSAGQGSKGPRFYHWAWITIDTATTHSGQQWLLIRHNRASGELAYYRCYTPEPVSLLTLVRVAGRRWTVEESFQAGKGLTGLDQHQVRHWTSWQRWTLLKVVPY
jgi:SRSO17 transposase